MRGKDQVDVVNVPFEGITPAYAGKSRIRGGCVGAGGDHPRVCGEKPYTRRMRRRRRGSPPRMRGKVLSVSSMSSSHRITPAYAGKSWAMPISPCRTRDHPRVCGEKGYPFRVPTAPPGSPPRMRGKEVVEPQRSSNYRITPAYAGKRLKRSHSIGHFSCILCLFHSVLHRASVSDGSRAGPCAPPCLPAQNAVPV